MKEHPDYKYRPRRKPKPLMKKEPKFGFSISPLLTSSHLENPQLSRSLMPPISSASGLSSFDHEHLKLQRALFPPLPYLYHPFRHPDESKFAAELALLYSNNPIYPPGLNWSVANNVNNSVPCNICPATFPRRSPSPESIKRPVCVIMKNDEFRNEPLPAHVIWKPLPVLPDRLNLGTWFSDISNLATSSAASTSSGVVEYRDSNSGRDSNSPCDLSEKNVRFHNWAGYKP